MADQEPTIEQVIAGIMNIRERKKALKDTYDAEKSRLDKMEENGELYILAQMQKLGIDNCKTVYGTAYAQTKMKSSIGDWNQFANWMLQTGHIDLLQHQINTQNLKDFLAENGNTLPPGVNTFNTRTVTIRRS